MKTEQEKNPIPLTARAFEVKEVGRIVYDVFDEGLRFIIMRGPASFCAYVGVPESHPLAGFDYDSVSFIDAHGGLTFAGEGGGTYKKENKKDEPMPWPVGFYWYGWDYLHAGDISVYDYKYNFESIGEHDWTVEEIIKDSWGALCGFKKLMKFAEQIKQKNNL